MTSDSKTCFSGEIAASYEVEQSAERCGDSTIGQWKNIVKEVCHIISAYVSARINCQLDRATTAEKRSLHICLEKWSL